MKKASPATNVALPKEGPLSVMSPSSTARAGKCRKGG
jgi:hypothetical protein